MRRTALVLLAVVQGLAAALAAAVAHVDPATSLLTGDGTAADAVWLAALLAVRIAAVAATPPLLVLVLWPRPPPPVVRTPGR